MAMHLNSQRETITEAALYEELNRLGFESFRPGQLEAIQTLLSEKNLLLVAPTGGGKSLTYQLPASILPGTTLVISPLIALMNDQVNSLDKAGIRATYLASTLPRDELQNRLRQIQAGHYKIVYVSPERLSFTGFRNILENLICPLIAIDEAHCISEWGHDFRPEYMRIHETLQLLPNARIMACTATATPIVRDEILAKLKLPPTTPQILKGFARPNLALNCIDLRSKKERIKHTDAMLSKALGGPGSQKGTAIIYGPTRKSTQEECARLQNAGWATGVYHAGLNPKQRELVQHQFQNGNLEIVIATNAFGMGIDRSDVRAVIHLGAPGSIEAYYQEVGRAGRDNERSFGLLFTSANDLPRRRHLIESPLDGMVPPVEVVEHKWNLFLELMRWTEGGTCRHDSILRYFGDEAESLDGCGICDICLNLTQADEHSSEEIQLIVRKALSGIARIHGRFGLKAAVPLLRGKDDERLIRAGLDNISTFGVLHEYSEQWITSLLRRCVTAGWVSFVGGDRPVAILTEAGISAMKGERPIQLILPPKRQNQNKNSPHTDSTITLDSEFCRNIQALFEELREFRLQEARKEGVPPYVVASDRTLRDLATLKPRNIDELCLAHGIGPAKARKYGAGLLRVISNC